MHHDFRVRRSTANGLDSICLLVVFGVMALLLYFFWGAATLLLHPVFVLGVFGLIALTAAVFAAALLIKIISLGRLRRRPTLLVSPGDLKQAEMIERAHDVMGNGATGKRNHLT